MTADGQLEELYALCHVFGISFRRVMEPWKSTTDYTHQLYVTDADTGRLLRQETIYGICEAAWRATIERLLSAKPQPLW